MGRTLKWIAFSVAAVLALGAVWRLLLAAAGGLDVSSWWRSPSRNREVGGARGSAHLIGWAFDVGPKNARTRLILENLGLYVLPDSAYPNHLHGQVTWRTPFLAVARLLMPLRERE
jgi:hypothetical protein